jgi:hypothetical protein
MTIAVAKLPGRIGIHCLGFGVRLCAGCPELYLPELYS